MTLHVPTLVLMLVIGYGLLTLLLAVAGHGGLKRGELRQLGWAAQALCLGFLCFALRPWLPGWLSLLGGNLLLMVGLALFAAALSWHLLNRGLSNWFLGLLVAAAMSVPLVLDATTPLRVGVMSGAMAVLLLPSTVAALRHGWRGELSFRVVALMLLLACSALVARLVYAVWWAGAGPAAGGEAAFWSGAIFMLAFMAVLAAGFGFVLAGFERMASQMRKLASVDGLTGAFNHNTTVSLLAHTLERGRRENQPVSFVMLDLDHFKQVNDRHGHVVGDAVLRAVAACTRARLRGSDVLGRLGGEEFGLVLPATGLSGARHLAEQVRLAVEGLALEGDGGRPLRVTLSAGVAEAARSDTPETLIHLADKALYQAKQQGRNRVVVADDWMRNSTLQSVVG
ncbi:MULTISPECIES: GGDEF domain-containing protein [Roseateles]|uniref:diguanylate cyclase n=1 Tax=Pelomonas caseinilytica TaxID=2906763 RepID=A0ABS8XF85_9BURK|nr:MULTISPECIES: GGDEF domain-containing protein [unclassified Roseateles]MCE4539552.1 GGDEF domain-containing protein [Pelomonas sp. P7]HEV6967462.1 GGDEF domain-containing protein [Roseateles sp.]